MKITALKQQIKNPQRVSVFVDETYSFSLTLDEVLKYKVKKSDELTTADIKKFKQISTDGKLKMRALEWLLNRPHSTREFKDYLYRKKAEPEQTESLVEEFTRRGYLDDTKFGVWFIELQSRRNKSNRAIGAELFKKGISRELAAELLGQEAGDEQKRLRALINKKKDLTRYKNDPLKLIKYLTSQGFSYSLIKQQLESKQPED